MALKQIQNILYENIKRYYYLVIMFSVWTLLGLFMTIQIYVSLSQSGKGDLTSAFLVSFSYSYSWFFLSPLILNLIQKLPITKEKWIKHIIIFLIVGIIFVFCTLGIYRYFIWLIIDSQTKPFKIWEMFQSILMNFDYGLISYLLNILIIFLIDYYRRFRERELTTSQLETQLIQAQMQSLKMQLHPHFLFNTLHAIGVLVRKNDNEIALKMLTGLSDLLRHTLTTFNTDEVPLYQEIQILNLYLDIQQIRFQDRLRIRVNIPPETENINIPNLILQPLAENAIQHGISKLSSAKRIDISASKNDNFLTIVISDDGPGLPDDWERLKQNGIGLINTEFRLQKIYGESFKLNLRNNQYGGASVILSLPLRKKTVYFS
jgi:two-component system, LytTR family, sensor kinase